MKSDLTTLPRLNVNDLAMQSARGLIIAKPKVLFPKENKKHYSPLLILKSHIHPLHPPLVKRTLPLHQRHQRLPANLLCLPNQRNLTDSRPAQHPLQILPRDKRLRLAVVEVERQEDVRKRRVRDRVFGDDPLAVEHVAFWELGIERQQGSERRAVSGEPGCERLELRVGGVINVM